MKKVAIFLFSIFLSACASTSPQIKTEYIQLNVPETLFYCPEEKVPSSTGLTNRVVLNTIKNLVVANKTCRTNMTAIKEYVDKSNQNINASNSTTN